MAALAMPKGTEAERAERHKAMQQATLLAARIPLMTMHAALDTMPLLREMAAKGNPASASDAGVGALAARAAVHGAALNVRINAASLDDKELARTLTDEAAELCAEADKAEAEIIETVNNHINI